MRAIGTNCLIGPEAVSNFRCNYSKGFFTYLATFDITALTGKPPFRGYRIRNYHQFYVNAGERVIRFSRSRPEPVIQREPRSTGTR